MLKNMFKKIIKWIYEKYKIVDWNKVRLNILFTAVIPIILFTLPVISKTGKSDFWGDWNQYIFQKLHQGVLFSTVISVSSGIVLSYRPKFKTTFLDVFSGSNEEIIANDSIEKLLPLYLNVPVIIFAFITMLLSAYYYGQIPPGENLNCVGIVMEIILFLLVQILYGYTEGLLVKNKDQQPEDLFRKKDDFATKSREQKGEDLDNLEDSEDIKKILQMRNLGGDK